MKQDFLDKVDNGFRSLARIRGILTKVYEVSEQEVEVSIPSRGLGGL